VSAVAAAQPHADVSSPEAYAARLYERHSRAIFGLCLKQLRRREDADDAVQTTFIYALLSLRRGVIPQLELPWLITIAKNVCSTRRRSGMRRGTYETPQDLDTIQDKLATPDRSDVATSEDFRTALRAIPESQRRALLLREWKGLSYDEIGTELGLSQAATEALLFRARQNVAQRLGGKAGRATFNGLPFFSFLRNLFQTAAAKTLAVGTGAALTIVAIPAGEPAAPDVAARVPVTTQTQTARSDASTPSNSRSDSVRAAAHLSTPRPAAASHIGRVPRVAADVGADVTAGSRDLTPAPARADVGGPAPAAPPSTSNIEATATAPLEQVDEVIQTTADVGEALGLPPVTVPPVKLPAPPVQLPALPAPTLPSLDLP
jgi:RNA polymerase sigma-70 factor, ECF subfamily